MTTRALPALLAAALLFITWSPAAAQDMTVFGIPPGQRLELPECPKSERPSCANGFRYKEAPEPQRTCFVGLSDIKINDRVAIQFPEKETPGVTVGGSWFGISATVINGNVEGVKFGTFGIRNAPLVLDALTAKYGTPTDLITSKVQNSFGASFDAITGMWTLPGAADPKLTIVFRSVCESTLDEGCVTIDTQKGHARRKLRLAEKSKDRRPL